MTEVQEKTEWKSAACGLCFSNCGIQVQLGGEGGKHIVRVKGDKNHPASRGYTCNKALQIDYYQNRKDRLTNPLRRRDDGSFEEIDWETAISEVAEKLKAVRDEHGGDKIFRYSGGSQGGQIGFAYAGPVSNALEMRYSTNPLAQEKRAYPGMSQGCMAQMSMENCTRQTLFSLLARTHGSPMAFRGRGFLFANCQRTPKKR